MVSGAVPDTYPSYQLGAIGHNLALYLLRDVREVPSLETRYSVLGFFLYTVSIYNVDSPYG
jgi:hypothetical protein